MCSTPLGAPRSPGRASPRPAARTGPGAPRGRRHQLLLDLGAQLAHQVHGPADRAVGALGRTGGQVASRSGVASLAQPERRPSSLTASSATEPTASARRRRSSRGRRPGSCHLPVSSTGPRRTAPAAHPAPPGPGDAIARQAGWERDQPTIRSHGHDQIVAIARQMNLGARDERQREPQHGAVLAAADPERAAAPCASPAGRRRAYSSRASASAPSPRPAPRAGTPSARSAARRRTPPTRSSTSSWATTQPARQSSAPRPGRSGWRRRRRRGSRRATASCTHGAPRRARRSPG